MLRTNLALPLFTAFLTLIALDPKGSRARAASDVDATLQRVMALLPGVYSTADQIKDETAAGVPEASRHPLRYVVYASIAVPQIGPTVLFREEHAGDVAGPVIARSLAVLAPDPAAQGVRMWLRQILESEHFADLQAHPELWPQVAIDPTYGSKCPFHWRLRGDALVGELVGGRCEIVSNGGKPMAFESEWRLDRAALSIFDNTYDGGGVLLSGRADRVATLYRRLRP